MGPNGSAAAASSSELALGTTGRIISTDTSIINLTIVRATTGGSRRAALLQQNIVQSFTVRQCMMYVDTKHPAVTSKYSFVDLHAVIPTFVSKSLHRDHGEAFAVNVARVFNHLVGDTGVRYENAEHPACVHASTRSITRQARDVPDIGYCLDSSALPKWRHATLRSLRGQATFFVVPCGSITNFLAAPLSKSLYPCGASSSEIMVALQALAG